MDLFVWQIIFVISIFIAVIICCLVPILLMRNASYSSSSFECSKLLSWFNCLTGGVFLAMCFLGLLPNVHEQTLSVLQGFHWKTSFPIAECVVLTGFFLVLFVDQITQHYEKKRTPGMQKITEMKSLGMDDYDDDDSGSMGDDARRTLLYRDENETTTMQSTAPNKIDLMALSKYSDAIENGDHSDSCHLENGADLHSPHRELPLEDSSKSRKGHCHSHNQVIDLMESTPRGLRFLVLLFALSMHALFEGIVLGLQREVPKAVHLFTAIILHEAVVAATLGFNIAKAKHSVWTAVRYSLFFSVTIPVGIGLGMGIGQTPGTIGHLISGSLQGLAAGIFLHITFMQLLPEEFAHGRDGIIKTLFLFIGFLLLMTLNLIMGAEHAVVG